MERFVRRQAKDQAWVGTHAMDQHLKMICDEVAPSAHAILIVDQVGWHTSPKLDVPDNITLLPLLQRSSELNPAENVWQLETSKNLPGLIVL